MPFPHGNDCRCPEPGPDGGLLAYTVDCTHYWQLVRTLEQLADRPALRLASLPDVKPCDGTMTCACDRCAQDRAARVRRGVRDSDGIPIKVRRAA